ncbi:MAG: hypothetical protein A2W99_16830 [Bacteroidetes bacterium GWF2_33_16]|nr:MAG: hypothetical protein A2X00_13965 [Bacteroidetes bacterium GWE2_32_14]OFY03413.1 MAG: hypothetical protein A2W99_16830 [Bacteroidetes bacterium GWF2_33_16]
MGRLKYFVVIFFLFSGYKIFSQNFNNTYSQEYGKSWFFSLGGGIQMSGIKSEDFIHSNIAPALVINIGNWVTPEVAILVGYKGFYFTTISDNDKHYYIFFYGEVLFNVNELINGKNIANNTWSLIVHPGAGYFYNSYYNQPNICANFGITNSFQVFERFEIFIDVSAIMGWDIYQGDEDILPSCVLGLTYSL